MRGEGLGAKCFFGRWGNFRSQDSLCLGVLGMAKKILQPKCDGTIKVKNAKKKKNIPLWYMAMTYGKKYFAWISTLFIEIQRAEQESNLNLWTHKSRAIHTPHIP